MISVAQKRELKRCLNRFFLEDEPLAPRTTFKTGGRASVFLEPETLTDLRMAVKILMEMKLGFLLLGGGSNLLVADAGIRDRAVISLTRSFRDYTIVGSDKNVVMVRVEGGVQLAEFVRLSVISGYSGLENLAGIPGTLGGALAMNAGAFGSTIYDRLAAISLIHNSLLEWRSATELNPGYRDGGLEGQDIVVAAYFLLPRQTPSIIAGKVAEIRNLRRQHLPSGAHAGSVFKNPAGDFAGRLLEEAGCKGMVFGGARVAVEHANVITAGSGSTTQDVVNLMEKMQDRVKVHCGVTLEPEIRVVS